MLDSFLLRGTASPPPEPIELRAGPLHLLFEPETGMIRRICYGEIEIWRGLYAAVRNHNWGTVTPRLFNLEMDIKDDSFEISFDVECKQDEIDFLWRGNLRGLSTGQIFYDFFGKARSNFQRNRIGFCLLHPPSCAGAHCELVDGGGIQIAGQFPQYIAPHQPFKDLHRLSHEFAPGQWGHAIFHGDIFETEDQRNWTDASFKTYCTPLDLPFPVEVKQGTKIEQMVILALASTALSPASKPSAIKQNDVVTIRLEEGASPTPLPAIGLCMASQGEQLTENEITRLRLLNLSHMRADLRFDGDWQARFQQAAQEARALETKLELALHLPHEPQDILREVITALEENAPSIARFLIFSQGEKVTSEATARAARAVLGSHGAPLVSGTDFYFTEVNRQHPPIDLLDGICFSITPQVHAFDDMSLIENLEMQATVIENARRLFGLPIHISPVTFKKRSNPDATAAEGQNVSDELPSDVDPRQMSLFGAAWTLGSLKTLCEAGAASLTYYETTGMKGVMQRENAIPHPQFPVPSNCVFPLFHVFADWLRDGGEFESLYASSEQITAFHLMRHHTEHRMEFYPDLTIFVANLTNQTQRFIFPHVTCAATIQRLDASNVTNFLTNTLNSEPTQYVILPGPMPISPYSVIRLKVEW
jgi:hypothetical protein